MDASPFCGSAVLLVVWNRPWETRRALDAIRAARPARLFVAGDGPRGATDEGPVSEVREIVDAMVDWPCELRTNYSPTNQGCRIGVTRAIDWFFSEVEEGIILEDDCVASPDFFSFCDEMLERYRYSDRVMHVAGDNTARVKIEQDWSYCFVRYPHIWGWATWRRAWAAYDRELSKWAAFRDSGQLSDLFPEIDERQTWVPIFDRLHDEGQPDTWDWQWAATCMMADGLAVQPTANLVSNVGFNERATHTRKENSRSNMEHEAVFPLRHPPVVYRHRDAERQIFLNTQSGRRLAREKNPWMQRGERLKNLARRVVRGRAS